MPLQNVTKNIKKPTALGFELTTVQNILINYLLASIGGALLYILQFACDTVVAYRHYSEENPIWASLTVFFMYLPILGSFVLTVSAWELWPEFEGCGKKNILWAAIKCLEHIFFPIWSMWRYAEKIFWSIEGLRSQDEEDREECLRHITAPRTIEFYFFLQAYLQAAPQILLQLHILVRNVSEMEKQTVDAQVLSVVMSLAKMSVTTTLYQRFKSQKVAGKSYPWFKSYKYPYDLSIENAPLRRAQAVSFTNDTVNVRPKNLERRRSSDFYETPTSSFAEDKVKSDTPSTSNVEIRDGRTIDESRETSVVDGPKRLVLKDPALTDETDFFSPRRLREIKGLPEDDAAGKMIAFLWWFCFLVSRMLAISAFAYFYPTEIIWILSSHFIITVSFLIYDVRADQVRRSKAIFFIFLGFVYLFCLIEFKIRFKKAYFIFYGFFTLVFLENFTMCLVWWLRNLEDIMNDWWYEFMFYLIVLTSSLSFVSMLLYFCVFKPRRVVVGVEAEK